MAVANVVDVFPGHLPHLNSRTYDQRCVEEIEVAKEWWETWELSLMIPSIFFEDTLSVTCSETLIGPVDVS